MCCSPPIVLSLLYVFGIILCNDNVLTQASHGALRNDALAPSSSSSPTGAPPQFNARCDFGPDALNGLVDGIDIPRTCLQTETGERCFYTFVPECASGSVPVVLDIHGFNSCPSRLARYSGWLRQATENCFVVVWPTGNINATITEESCWSTPAGLGLGPEGQPTVPCCCDAEPDVTKDIGFIRSVIRSVVQDVVPAWTSSGVSIDTKRIYMAGHSNGCMLSMAMAALHSDLVAAVCCHAGSVLTPVAADYIETPVWRVHGTGDLSVPYIGRFDRNRNAQVFTSAVGGHDYYGRVNGCQESGTENFVRNLNIGNIRRYTNCNNGADVVLVSINLAGHYPYLSGLDFPVATTFDTTAWAWDFCSSYSSLTEPDLGGGDNTTATPTVVESSTPSLSPSGSFIPSANPFPSASPTAQKSFPRCFAGTNQVHVIRENQRKEFILLEELRIGDKVLVNHRGQYEAVYGFAHYHKTLRTEYLRLTFSLPHKSSSVLEISSEHLAWVVMAGGEKLKSVPASNLAVGDSLVVSVLGETPSKQGKIQKIETIVRSGLYAPLTPSGTVVVSGVLVSNYVTLQPNTGVLVLGDFLQTPFTFHWLSHAIQTPHRLFCTSTIVSGQFCARHERYNEQGISVWLSGPLQLTQQWYLGSKCNLAGMLLLTVLLVMVSLLLQLLEGCWFILPVACCWALFVILCRPHDAGISFRLGRAYLKKGD